MAKKPIKRIGVIIRFVKKGKILLESVFKNPKPLKEKIKNLYLLWKIICEII
jgi:hypothetical protein